PVPVRVRKRNLLRCGGGVVEAEKWVGNSRRSCRPKGRASTDPPGSPSKGCNYVRRSEPASQSRRSDGRRLPATPHLQVGRGVGLTLGPREAAYCRQPGRHPSVHEVDSQMDLLAARAEVAKGEPEVDQAEVDQAAGSRIQSDDQDQLR